MSIYSLNKDKGSFYNSFEEIVIKKNYYVDYL